MILQGKQGGFLSAKYLTERHTDLEPDRRAILHELLRALHHNIFVGRREVAEHFAGALARLCERGAQP